MTIASKENCGVGRKRNYVIFGNINSGVIHYSFTSGGWKSFDAKTCEHILKVLNTSVFPSGAHRIDLLAHFVGETDSVGSGDVFLELVCAPGARDDGRNRLWL